MLDLTSDWGRSVERLLRTAPVIWLTTIARDGTPWPNPVWFLWDGESFLVYSRTGSAKDRHVARDPRVTLNLNGDGWDLDIAVFRGEARIDRSVPPPNDNADYMQKYGESIARLGMTPEEYGATFATPIRVKPLSARGH